VVNTKSNYYNHSMKKYGMIRIFLLRSSRFVSFFIYFHLELLNKINLWPDGLPYKELKN